MSLQALGWSDHFARQLEAIGQIDLVAVRAVRVDGETVLADSGSQTYRTLLPSRFLLAEPEGRPAIGDWLAVILLEDGQAVLHAVLDRASVLMRKSPGTPTRPQVLAANVDTAFLVSGLDGDFNIRRIERYLTQTLAGGIRPVIVLNKADQCTDVWDRLASIRRAAPGVAVAVVSARTGTGLDELRSHLEPGRTVVFLGSSGVGKSTLINRLIGKDVQATFEVRPDDSRGRHTTTRRELFLLPGGELVIDTPGLRELQLWADQTSLGEAFPDIEELSVNCRYRDCTHEAEPGCAVNAAVALGRLDAQRLASYRKLLKEVGSLEDRRDAGARHDARKRERRFGREMARYKRDNPKGR